VRNTNPRPGNPLGDFRTLNPLGYSSQMKTRGAASTADLETSVNESKPSSRQSVCRALLAAGDASSSARGRLTDEPCDVTSSVSIRRSVHAAQSVRPSVYPASICAQCRRPAWRHVTWYIDAGGPGYWVDAAAQAELLLTGVDA